MWLWHVMCDVWHVTSTLKRTITKSTLTWVAVLCALHRWFMPGARCDFNIPIFVPWLLVLSILPVHPIWLLLFLTFLGHCLALALLVLCVCHPLCLPGDPFHLSTKLCQLPCVMVESWRLEGQATKKPPIAISISLVLVAFATVFFICLCFSPPLSDVFISTIFSLSFHFLPLVAHSIATVNTPKVHLTFKCWHWLHVGVHTPLASSHPLLLLLCLHRSQGGLNPMMPVLEQAVTWQG